MTTKEAIERRRSIRRYRPEPVPEEQVMQLIEAARLAPSGSNAQPWRFKIVTDRATRERLAAAARSQPFVAQAPVVIVCCADVEGYIEGTVSGAQDLGRTGVLEGRIVDILLERAKALRGEAAADIGPRAAANVAIAVEHMVLRALDFGLGTCWVRMFDERAVRDIFGWGENLFVVALLPVGYPAEAPAPRKRLSIEEILLD